MMIDRLLAALLLGLLCQFSPAAEHSRQALSEQERAIVAVIDENQAAARELLREVVNINSGSMNFDGVRRVGAVFRAAFETLGFDVEWVDGKSWGRAGHLIARHGDKGLHFVLIGHLDTVFQQNSPFQRYQAKQGDWISGPGISDMKGGDVVILEALRALQQTGVLDEMTVSVVLIGDEESSGRPLALARSDLKALAKEADVALAFENGDDDPSTAVIARRGYTGWQLEVEARPAHSSLIFKPEIGSGAIYETARILNRFRQELAGEQYLTVNPGLILGGTAVDYDGQHTKGTAFGKPNVIAQYARVSGDLRTLTESQRDNAKSRMQAMVNQNLPHSSARLTFSAGYPALAPSAGNRKLLGMYSQVSQDLGYGPVTAVDPAAAGAADVSFTAGLVDMAIDGLGLLGKGAHTIKEQARISLLPEQTERAAILMLRLAQNDSPRAFSGVQDGNGD